MNKYQKQRALAARIRRAANGSHNMDRLNALADKVQELEESFERVVTGRPGKPRVELWEAIHEYVRACGGEPGDGLYGNIPAQNAVVEVERAVQAEVLGLHNRQLISAITRIKDVMVALDGVVVKPLLNELEFALRDIQEVTPVLEIVTPALSAVDTQKLERFFAEANAEDPGQNRVRILNTCGDPVPNVEAPTTQFEDAVAHVRVRPVEEPKAIRDRAFATPCSHCGAQPRYNGYADPNPGFYCNTKYDYRSEPDCWCPGCDAPVSAERWLELHGKAVVSAERLDQLAPDGSARDLFSHPGGGDDE